MATTKNYLLGYGERLSEKLDPPKFRPQKKDWYTFDVAKNRLAPRISEVAEEIDDLPDRACPNNESVAVITLHPSYLAKSFFPTNLLRAVGLEAVGSRAQQIVPEKGPKKQSKKGHVATSATTELFVAGPRPQFQKWAASVSRWTERTSGAEELIRVEQIYFVPPESRLQPIRSDADAPLLEIVLHAPDDYIIEGFRDYMKDLGVKVDLDRRFQVEGLCFLGARIPKDVRVEMAKFSFLRVARLMPRLRQLHPMGILRSSGLKGFACKLPTRDALSPDLRVAIFDGGVPSDANLDKWVNRKKASKLAAAHPDAQAHGLGVTSAVLFGPLKDGQPLPQPYANVDHFRVIDEDTSDPEGNYYDLLDRITSVLSQKQYDFVNLSLGPEVAFDDNEVHLWTLKLDQLFADGQTFVSVAAGNTGAGDLLSGAARVQSPSDGVNVLGVGACNSLGNKWKRAAYSSQGPGRSPGVMKPDVVAFGGSDGEPFWLLDSSKPNFARADAGTSFASPLALRTAIGVRAHLGPVVRPVALKALLVHHSEDRKHSSQEVGWGRIPFEIDDLITSGPGVAHILYQGILEPGKYVRVRIPVPNTAMQGKVTISATFCYATETDPQDIVNYTRAGLDVKFRPDKSKRTKREDGTIPEHPDTKAFFQLGVFNTEEALRRDAHQWETCVRRTRNFQAKTLNDPMFDIHYNARKGGHQYVSAKPIPYALIVSVIAKKVPDLYDRIAQRYRTQLEPLRPVIQIPIKVQ
jgi:Subtilase family